MKDILLAGGSGSRLYPITRSVFKQLLPVYDKAIIYYPLSVLMLAGMRDILIIVTPEEMSLFKRFPSTGKTFCVYRTYAAQLNPDGIAQAFLIGESFINNDCCCLVVDENIYFGQGFSPKLQRIASREQDPTLFAYQVMDPESFGVVVFDKAFRAITLEEKPENPYSCLAVTELYFYDCQIVKFARRVAPSARKELEITSINQMYLEKGRLYVELLDRGFSCLNTATHDSLIQASTVVRTLEKRQGV